MKIIFTDDEREQIYNVYMSIAQNREIKMTPDEAKTLTEIVERTSGYRGKEKYTREMLTSIGHVLAQIVRDNPKPSKDFKENIKLYRSIVEKIERKLGDDQVLPV